MAKSTKGKLYLIPNTLGGPADAYIHGLSQRVVSEVRTYLIEEIKSARRLMRALGYQGDFNDVVFIPLNEHTRDEDWMEQLQPLIQGTSMAVISEAGLPCVADPGEQAVLLAHQLGVQVVPISGPSSIMMALMASGLNGQEFTFNGYLPKDRQERQRKLKSMEQMAMRKHTQIFMDAPYRNNQVLEDVLKLNPRLHLCIASNISTDQERINTRSLEEWKSRTPDLHKQPVMFVLGY